MNKNSSSPVIGLYTRKNIDQLKWPEDQDGLYAQNYLLPLLKEGTLRFIDNIDVEIQILIFNNKILPLVLAEPHARVKNSYVCSPTAHYIDYALEELEIELRERPLPKLIFAGIIKLIAAFFKRCDFEKVVYINNWLLSTNLYPDFNPEDLEVINAFLIKQFPNRPIIYRSLNEMLNLPLINKLSNLRCRKVFSRQVYILDPAKKTYLKKDSYRKDLRLKKRTAYHWEGAESIREEDLPRCKKLYDLLYLDKYSPLNPQFNENFYKDSLKKNYISYHILKKDGQIDGIIGYFVRNGVITTPVFGYDTNLPSETGLYRLGALKVLETAIEHNWLLHKSSGVSKYKLHRGAEPSVEYNMVYDQHLDFKQKLPWFLLEKLTKYLVIPVMQKYQL